METVRGNLSSEWSMETEIQDSRLMGTGASLLWVVPSGEARIILKGGAYISEEVRRPGS